MTQIRLLIPVTYQFSVRYILRTGLLERLKTFCEPIIVLCWDDERLQQELAAADIEVYRMPETVYGPAYLETRRWVEIWHQYYNLKTVTTAIDYRRADKNHPLWGQLQLKTRRLVQRLRLLQPGAEERLLAQEQKLLQQDTNLDVFARFLADCRAEAVFSVTPYHRQEELLLRAAATAHLPLCTSIISFDNVTTRGWFSTTFDHYLVWNCYNEQELRRSYPSTANKPIEIVGPAQFDFYWQPQYMWSEIVWRQRLNLPDNRPVILFGGGPQNIVPHEPHFLEQLDEAISQGELPHNPIILFRRHPMDPPERWQAVSRKTRHVVYDEPWKAHDIIKYSNIQQDDIAKLTSTLCHSAIHINTSSTMALDGAVFDRPQIGPAYDDRPGRPYDRICRDLYDREHFLPITRSGGLTLAYSRKEMIQAVKEALEAPEKHAAARQQMVREICTFTDGRCTERVANGVRSFLGL